MANAWNKQFKIHGKRTDTVASFPAYFYWEITHKHSNKGGFGQTIESKN